MNNDNIAHLKVQELQTGMKAHLHADIPSEGHVGHDNEWETITRCSGYGNITVIETSTNNYEKENGTIILVSTS